MNESVPPEDRTPSVPTRIGRYEIRGVLGAGTFGRVYHGYDAELDREVAVKVPHPDGLTPTLRERFRREARAGARVRHPNVCPVYDAGTAGGLPFLVMPHFPGGVVATRLADLSRPLPVRSGVGVAWQAALGVAAAHAAGVVHCSLSTRCLLWDEAVRRVLVADFETARLEGEDDWDRSSVVMGVPTLPAPEACRGEPGAGGPAADVFSLGVILYRLLTGEQLYTGTVYEIMVQAYEGKARPPSALRPGLDPALDAICLRATAADPAARYSAAALAAALGAYLRGGTAAPE